MKITNYTRAVTAAAKTYQDADTWAVYRIEAHGDNLARALLLDGLTGAQAATIAAELNTALRQLP